MRRLFWTAAVVAACSAHLAWAGGGICDAHPLGLRALACDPTSKLLGVTNEEMTLLQLKHIAPEPAVLLQASEARWRESVFARCLDANCVDSAYKHRTEDLQRQITNLLAQSVRPDRRPRSAPLNNESALRICKLAATVASRDGWRSIGVPGSELNWMPAPSDKPSRGWRLSAVDREKLSHLTGAPADLARPWTLYRLPLRRGAEPVRFVEFQSGGTCASTLIMNLDQLLATPSGQQVNEDRMATVDADGQSGSNGEFFGANEQIIWLDHRYFVLTAWERRTARLNWIDPNGHLLPACDLESTQTGQVPVAGGSLPVCKAIANGSARPLPWSDLFPDETSSQTSPAGATDVLGWSPDGAQHLRVDLDGSGHPRNLVRAWFSGAGCGQNRYQLTELDATGHSIPLPEEWLPTVDALSPFDVYDFDGINYLAVDQDGDRILAFERGTAHTVCELEPRFRWDVSKTYDLEKQPEWALVGTPAARSEAPGQSRTSAP